MIWMSFFRPVLHIGHPPFSCFRQKLDLTTIIAISAIASKGTVPAAIRELEKIEMVRQTDGKYRIDHAVTATQKAILKAFGIDVIKAMISS